MKSLHSLKIFALGFVLAFLLPAAPVALGQSRVEAKDWAPVTVDGEVLFHVGGIEAYPAQRRAGEIRDRIIALAEDPGFSPDSLLIEEGPESTKIQAGERTLFTVFELDAKRQEVTREGAARAAVAKIKEAIQKYREHRQPETLRSGRLFAAGATVVFVVLLFLIHWTFGKLLAQLKRRYASRIQAFKVGSLEVLQAERVQRILTTMIRSIKFVALLILFYLYLEMVLARFPSTRGFAGRLLGWVMDPLKAISLSIVGYLPDFFFLVVIVLLGFFAIRLIRVFFLGLEQGAVEIPGFDPEWAKPTFNLVRILAVAFILVVAYPYIPGSDSEAFKGISLFIGLLVSLGSSSIVSNLIAGYSMIYRGTFKVGDRIQVGEHIGDVTICRLLTTQLKTVKNEKVIIPNSLILGTSVVNYSTLAKEKGLILHSNVGVGYEVPWRQVEAMLKLAAERTPGLLREPSPFVHQKALGDFAVDYEINAYCQEPQRMAQLYAALHRNILDVFNEHGVQIMTPAYEGDPESPKVVPKDRWYESPAEAPKPDPSR
ncbi:MAG TPA: mechanosensitive ion channel domain-containing protein [bacterium]|nr:mechanosensitive ion channel domain-containing protein [bacterium]